MCKLSEFLLLHSKLEAFNSKSSLISPEPNGYKFISALWWKKLKERKLLFFESGIQPLIQPKRSFGTKENKITKTNGKKREEKGDLFLSILTLNFAIDYGSNLATLSICNQGSPKYQYWEDDRRNDSGQILNCKTVKVKALQVEATSRNHKRSATIT